MDADSSSVRQLTRHDAPDMVPAWSPDGREIAFNSARSGNNDIWVIPAEGGEPRQLTDDPSVDWIPRWSPDGEWIYFSSTRSGDSLLWRVPAAGGKAITVTDRPAGMSCPLEDGKNILFSSRDGRDIWIHSLEDGTEHPVTDFSARRGNLYNALASDGDYLYFSWGEDLGDIWVMDVVYE